MVDPDGITVSGGGSIAVATDDLSAASAILHSIHAELIDSERELAAIDRLVTAGRLRTVDAPLSAQEAERAIDDAAVLIGRARLTASLLGTALDRSADGYGLAEAATQRSAEAAAASAGYVMGFTLPAFLLAAAPMLLGLAAVAGIASIAVSTLSAKDRKALARNLPVWLQQHSGELSDPKFVTLVRLTVTSLDDVGAGMLHVPLPLQEALAAGGLVGVGTSARAIVGLGGVVGRLKESPVRTVETSRTSGGSLPQGWEDRASRVPAEDSQVRIDRYTVPGEPDRFEVYVSGTREFALGPDSQPWDMTSNVNGIAGGSPGSVRAVEQAMAQAGITSSSPVLFTGYSQGGLVTAIIAGSGDYDAQGLYTLGAPAAQATLPASIPWVAVEHTNDIVPALSGSWAHSDPVLVQRQIYTSPPVGTDKFFPSHQLGAYESTAGMLDDATEPRVTAVEQKFTHFTENATPVESTTWKSERVPGPPG
jgi:hypothetical protein